MLKGFVEFIRKQGVVGVAVAFILGGAISKFVSAFVADFINPLLGLALGAVKGLESASFTIAGATFTYGHFLMSAIDFAAIAMVVYFGVKLTGLEKLDKKD